MKNKKFALGIYSAIILFSVIQLVSLAILYFTGLATVSTAVFIVASLGVLVAASMAYQAFSIRFSIATTVIGLLFYLTYVLVGIHSIVVLLVGLLIITEILILLWGMTPKKKTVVVKAPKVQIYHDVKKEQEDLQKETKNIFKELEKIEADIKKIEKKPAKKKTVSVKQKRARKSVSKETKKFSAIKGGKTFHLPSCNILLRQDPKKYVHYGTRQKALGQGYRPCRSCNP